MAWGWLTLSSRQWSTTDLQVREKRSFNHIQYNRGKQMKIGSHYRSHSRCNGFSLDHSDVFLRPDEITLKTTTTTGQGERQGTQSFFPITYKKTVFFRSFGLDIDQLERNRNKRWAFIGLHRDWLTRARWKSLTDRPRSTTVWHSIFVSIRQLPDFATRRSNTTFHGKWAVSSATAATVWTNLAPDV